MLKDQVKYQIMDKDADRSTLGVDWDAQDSIGQGDDESLSLAHSQTQPSPGTVNMNY